MVSQEVITVLSKSNKASRVANNMRAGGREHFAID
jgi:hypothetical protein